MVLLTSSAISVIISSGVVCIFTFLLFLSGYVVQQQTVRSLQEALRPPPVPTTTLQAYFEDAVKDEQTENTISERITSPSPTSGPPSPHPPLEQEITVNILPIPAQRSDEVEHREKASIQANNPDGNTLSSIKGSKLAYLQLLSQPSQICSALLFFKTRMESGDSTIGHIIAYPSYWERKTSSEPIRTALALMQVLKDEYKLTYQAVSVSDSQEDQEVQKELMAHLTAQKWEYDRMLYLRSPGLALNVRELDSALQASRTSSRLSRNWGPVNPQASITPSMLLMSGNAIYSPRGGSRRLISKALTSHANHHEGEMDIEAAAQTAAYVHFDEGELEHRRTEKEWYGGVFERYERGRAEVCTGISFEGASKELKRKRRRSL